LELDDTGVIIFYDEYHPYGTTAYQAMNASIGAVSKRYRFTSKERDEESGLYYHSARYYIPWLARWSAVDPRQADYATLSSYNYCLNNPVSFTDPDGNAAVYVPKGTSKDTTALATLTPAPNHTLPTNDPPPPAGSDTLVNPTQSSGSGTAATGSSTGQGATSVNENVNYIAPPLAEVVVHGKKMSWLEMLARKAERAANKAVDWVKDNAREIIDYVPFLGPAVTIFEGIKEGNLKKALLGTAGLVLDAAGGTILRYAGKAAKGAIKLLSKADEIVEGTGKKTLGTLGTVAARKLDDVLEFADYNQARNAALEWLEARGFKAEQKNLSKMALDPNSGQAIGMTDKTGKIGFRVEYGKVEIEKGVWEMRAHINVFDHTAIKGMQKGPHLLFPGDQSTVDRIIKRFNK
jgi:RHS repeat-associated protein